MCVFVHQLIFDAQGRSEVVHCALSCVGVHTKIIQSDFFLLLFQTLNVYMHMFLNGWIWCLACLKPVFHRQILNLIFFSKYLTNHDKPLYLTVISVYLICTSWLSIWSFIHFLQSKLNDTINIEYNQNLNKPFAFDFTSSTQFYANRLMVDGCENDMLTHSTTH